MKKEIKEMFNKECLKKHKNFIHIAIPIGYKNKANEIKGYLLNNNIDCSIIFDSKNHSFYYIRIYGKKECDKFISFIN